MTQTIEDVIFKINEVELSPADNPVLKSLRSQLLRNVSLTDRQYELAKEKLVNYQDELLALGITDLTMAMSTTGKPLRYIDRSKTITVIEKSDGNESSILTNNSQHARWIKITFPFNKKIIAAVEAIRKHGTTSYFHKKGDKSHYFALTESSVTTVVDTFRDRNFNIDNTLIAMAQEIADITANKSAYVPGIYNNKMLNLRSAAVELITQEIDITDINRNIKLYDRRFKYGLGHVDIEVPEGIISEILSRDCPIMSMTCESNSMNDIAAALTTLDRFPMLVIVNKQHALDQVSSVHGAFSNIASQQQSALFRVTSTPGPTVNDYIREQALNNWVDETTKIVYINNNKLPKVLLNSKWKPACTLNLSNQSIMNTHVDAYSTDHSDLVIQLVKDSDSKNRKR